MTANSLVSTQRTVSKSFREFQGKVLCEKAESVSFCDAKVERIDHCTLVEFASNRLNRRFKESLFFDVA